MKIRLNKYIVTKIYSLNIQKYENYIKDIRSNNLLMCVVSVILIDYIQTEIKCPNY